MRAIFEGGDPMRWTTMLYAVPVLLGLPLRAVAGAELAGWLPVADTTLAASRGGYDHGNGLLVSLSIERQLSLNGSEVASSRLVLPQLGAAGLQPARALGTGTPVHCRPM